MQTEENSVVLDLPDSLSPWFNGTHLVALTASSSGTDHGWGGHNLVMGWAVQGGDIYGQMPQVTRDSVDAVENNRTIPTTSVDQYSATLARRFGLSEAELSIVFPNLSNFASADVGFMA